MGFELSWISNHNPRRRGKPSDSDETGELPHPGCFINYNKLGLEFVSHRGVSSSHWGRADNALKLFEEFSVQVTGGVPEGGSLLRCEGALLVDKIEERPEVDVLVTMLLKVFESM
jgi:hypothetical protein